MEDGWFYAIDDETHGPVDAATLMRRMRDARDTWRVRVRRASSDIWYRASDVPGLLDQGLAAPDDAWEPPISCEYWLSAAVAGQILRVAALLPVVLTCIAYFATRRAKLPSSHQLPVALVIGHAAAFVVPYVVLTRDVIDALFNLAEIDVPVLLVVWYVARPTRLPLWLLILWQLGLFTLYAVDPATWFDRHLLIQPIMDAAASIGFGRIALGFAPMLRPSAKNMPGVFA